MAEKEEKQYVGNQPKCLAWIRLSSLMKTIPLPRHFPKQKEVKSWNK